MSPELVSFNATLARLKTSLIVERADESYPPEDFDKAAGFRVLASAHLEGYVEQRCLSVAAQGVDRFLKSQPTRVGRALVVWFGTVKLRRAIPLEAGECVPDRDVVTTALTAYRDSVKGTHGMSAKDLRALALPLGIQEQHIDPSLMDSLEVLAQKRQAAAHVPVGTKQMSTPRAEYDEVAKLLPALTKLDRDLEHVLMHFP